MSFFLTYLKYYYFDDINFYLNEEQVPDSFEDFKNIFSEIIKIR